MRISNVLCRMALSLVLITIISCGQGSKQLPTLSVVTPQQTVNEQPAVTWPGALPEDQLQPWETMDADGNVMPPKGTSNLNFDSIFASGIERYLEAGDVTTYGEASSFASGVAGGEEMSYAIYRLALGAEQPGTITADVNLHNGSSYYVGVGDYSVNTWHWYGPFSATHVRFNVPDAEYTSGIGNLMLAVVAYDGASFDVVAIGANARDAADMEAPPIPAAPTLTPVAGGVFAEWLEVAAGDLAGYRIYADGVEVLDYIEGGTSIVIPCADEVEVTLTAVDISGNESELSESATEMPLAGDMPVIELTATAASGARNDVIELAATGAETYDWDIDGDGTWDFTDDPTGMSEADTNDLGVIRPAVRAHTAEGGFSLNAISLFITGNFRPVVLATADVTSGPPPLDVNFTIVAEDDDGTIEEYAWDFDGDGTFDDSSAANPSPLPNTYMSAGMYNAKFRVTDNDGAWAVDTVAVQVLPEEPENLPPLADLSPPTSSGNAPHMVNFDASGSNDPDGTIELYEWDFDGDGIYDGYGTDPTISHTYTASGSYTATLQVTDNVGAQATDTCSIAVNALPDARMNASPPEGNKGVTVYYNASASSDPDGSITDYEWDLDDDGIFNEPGAEANAQGNSFVQVVYPNPGRHFVTVRVSDDATPVGTDTFRVRVTVHGWVLTTIDSTGNVGQSTSLAVVDGCPAISYYDVTNDDLKYARATTSAGGSSSDWTQIVTVDSAGDVGLYTTCLVVVDGCPAISYHDDTNHDLKYARATTSTGGIASDWTQIVTVDNENVGFYVSLATVDGCPAISYFEFNGDLKYARATTSTGSSPGDWVNITVDDGAMMGFFTSLAVVDGCPAISYYQGPASYDLRYARATTSTGSFPGDWVKITVDSGGYVGYDTSLAVVDGCPAISYYEATNDDLKYARATTSTGSSPGDWVKLTLDSGGEVGSYTSLAIVNGNPAISYWDKTNWDLKYARATTSTGGSASDWTQKLTVDSSGSVGGYTSLAVVDGCPAISYYDNINDDLKFAIHY